MRTAIKGTRRKSGLLSSRILRRDLVERLFCKSSNLVIFGLVFPDGIAHSKLMIWVLFRPSMKFQKGEPGVGESSILSKTMISRR